MKLNRPLETYFRIVVDIETKMTKFQVFDRNFLIGME